MTSYLLVFIGGGFGSAIRVFLSKVMGQTQIAMIPTGLLGTFFANMIGSFLLGALVAMSQKGKVPDSMTLLLAGGFCGGLTTFSTFIIELIHLQKENTTYYSIVYLMASIGIAVILATCSFFAFTKIID